jgi:hypothetical protein
LTLLKLLLLGRRSQSCSHRKIPALLLLLKQLMVQEGGGNGGGSWFTVASGATHDGISSSPSETAGGRLLLLRPWDNATVAIEVVARVSEEGVLDDVACLRLEMEEMLLVVVVVVR